jgi:hypothetical protein
MAPGMGGPVTGEAARPLVAQRELWTDAVLLTFACVANQGGAMQICQSRSMDCPDPSACHYRIVN